MRQAPERRLDLTNVFHVFYTSPCLRKSNKHPHDEVLISSSDEYVILTLIVPVVKKEH
jgi:hypothetical protein